MMDVKAKWPWIAGAAGLLVLVVLVNSYLGHIRADESMKATLQQQGENIQKNIETMKELQKTIAAINDRMERREEETARTLASLSARQQAIPQMRPDELIRQITESIAARQNPTNAKEAIVDSAELARLDLACRKCEVELSARREDVADLQSIVEKKDATLAEKDAQIQATEKQRDSAVKAAKGGGWFKRTLRGLKWVAVGIAVGAVLTL